MLIDSKPNLAQQCENSDVLRFVVNDGDALIFAVGSDSKAIAFWSQEGAQRPLLFKFVEQVVAGTTLKIACTAELEAKLRVLAARKKFVIEKNVGPLTRSEEFLFYSNGRVRRAPVSVQVSQSTQQIRKRVMIVDDSDTMRSVLEKVFAQDPRLEVVASIGNPLEAQRTIEKFKPDVMTLDIHMPHLDGPTLLGQVLARTFMPVVMISSVSFEDGDTVLRCLELGAVDYIQKPSFDQIKNLSSQINEKIFVASQIRKAQTASPKGPVGPLSTLKLDTNRLIAMGASTGGTEALKEILIRMPAEVPPILIVQHIPPVFSLAFARRLDQLCAFEVKEAQEGDRVIPGRALVAPGGYQMCLQKSGGGFVVRITEDAPVNRHKPSVDYLFDSVTKVFGRGAVGVVCTGMGADGARGLLNMKKAGSHTIVQDEASSVVFGMPGEAIKMGAATEVKPLLEIANSLQKNLRFEIRKTA